MWKQRKRNKIIRKINSPTISKSSKNKGKRNSSTFWTSSWWDNFCAIQKVSEEWKENFCMSQEIFKKLCTKLRPYIQKNKGFQDPSSVEKQVAATLFYFADEGRMRKVENSFGVRKSTILKIVRCVLFLL